ncbi:MAG: hypothetical protein AAFU66_07195, partial [Pseudomonadota bacterium]
MTPNRIIDTTFDVTVNDDASQISVRWSDRPSREAQTLSASDRQRIDECVAALGQAEAKRGDVLPAAHRLGAALFDMVDGPDRRLAQLATTAKQNG